MLRGLLGLDGAAGWGEVDVSLMEILMIEHEGVLIVDGDVLLLHESEREFVPLVDARVGGAFFCGISDGRGVGPDENCMGRKLTDGRDEGAQPLAVLLLGIGPTVHAVVEVNDGEGGGSNAGVSGDLIGKTRVAGGGGGGEKIAVGVACEETGGFGIVAAGDGVAEEQDVGEGWVGVLGAVGPGPLYFFGDGLSSDGLSLRGGGDGLREQTEERREQQNAGVALKHVCMVHGED